MTNDLLGGTNYLEPNLSFMTHTSIGNVTWVIPIILSCMTVLLITRKPEKWKVLLWPVLVGYSAIGFEINPFIYIPAIILFAQDSLSNMYPHGILSTMASTANARISKARGMLWEEQKLKWNIPQLQTTLKQRFIPRTYVGEQTKALKGKTGADRIEHYAQQLFLEKAIDSKAKNRLLNKLYAMSPNELAQKVPKMEQRLRRLGHLNYIERFVKSPSEKYYERRAREDIRNRNNQQPINVTKDGYVIPKKTYLLPIKKPIFSSHLPYNQMRTQGMTYDNSHRIQSIMNKNALNREQKSRIKRFYNKLKKQSEYDTY